MKIESFTGTAYSAINTDPSQQEILSTLGFEPKKIIQGPPGTGKSQSLTALITNALANNLKCLVVCEKKTAHDVIKNNLHRENDQLGALAAVIEDINKDRDTIVNSVRDRISNPLIFYSNNQINYNTVKKDIDTAVGELNNSHKKLGQSIYKGKSWTEIVGEFLKRENKTNYEALTKKLDYKQFEFTDNELSSYSAKIKTAKKLFSDIKVLSHPLDILNDELFAGENPRGIKVRLEDFTESTSLQLTDIELSLKNDTKEYLTWLDKYYLDIENELSVNLGALEKDLHNYSLWLDNHYSEYYNELLNLIADFKTFTFVNHQKFGESFFKNDGLTKFRINALSLFSDKYKELKVQRELIIPSITKIRMHHEKYDYINHTFVSIDEPHTTLRVLLDNVEELSLAFDKWKKKLENIKTKLIQQFNSKNTHPLYSNISLIVEIERIHERFVSDLTDDKYLDISKEDLKTHHLKIYTLKKLQKQFSEIDKFKKNYFDNFSQESKHKSYNSEVLTKNEKSFTEIINKIKNEKIIAEEFDNTENHSKKLSEIKKIISSINKISENLEGFREYYEWKNFILPLTSLEKRTIESLIEIDTDDWELTFEAWYYFWLLSINEHRDLPKNDDKILELFELKKDLKKNQIQNIVESWSKKQLASAKRLQQFSGLSPISLFNKRGAAGHKRNSLRKIVNTDFDLFTDFFPVVMVSPTVCSSIIPLNEALFDIVIFDEASQLRIEDTYSALIRGKIKIISGDSQQMPPTNFFQGGNALLNPNEDDYEEESTAQETENNIRNVNNSYELADSESLLVYAENCNYKQSYLKIHYRSQHPSLIDFSNHAFYGKRLIPMPAKKEYKPIEFIEVNGIYEDSVNREEAKSVVDILLHKIKKSENGKYPSIGVATFNLYQRNLILEEIAIARQSKPEYDKKIADLGSDFFVKNLENIQGDERDIIIISTTFGKKNDGNFRQNFGPIVQGKGYKLLNVIVTRAKQKVYVCCSIPLDNINQYPSLLQQFKNTGRGVLYSYLAYAKAVSDSNNEIKDLILNQLYENCESKLYDVEDTYGSESPFEEEVYYRLAQKIGEDRIQQQYPIGGFRIDMIIKSKLTGKPVIALECDGAKYHSSNEAYSWDMFRQTQLENQGFIFYRIWSTNWWNSIERELNKVVAFINQFDIIENKIPENLFDANNLEETEKE
ncbi:MAG TPA: AAA domain-containing protein [Flavobacterium sp.]|uniref:AAA domain-containing protein n=1 Tax=Flavobacterium sp. TaxID=239 RepID=UPI002DB8DEB7|nr:AAA domain-containing protein [Flavobacterium sp.]HEU4791660.1 AAA domain-containing protein [Flavobacterium sp.]